MNKDFEDMYFAEHIDGKNFGSMKEIFVMGLRLGAMDERTHWKERVAYIVKLMDQSEATESAIKDELKELGT